MNKLHNKYSWVAKNKNADDIYINRLRLINLLNINVYKSPKLYSYYLEAYLGIILK